MTDTYRTYLAKPGLTVFDPLDGAALPHEGAGKRVRVTSYWLRREADGSLVVVPDAEASAPVTKKSRAPRGEES